MRIISSINMKHKQEVLSPKQQLDRDLKFCMKCKYFWGNDNRCITNRCYNDKKKPIKQNIDKESECDGCTYRQSEGYCFPCMKNLLDRK